MALPDLGDEPNARREALELGSRCGPVDLTFADLRPLTVEPLGVDDVRAGIADGPFTAEQALITLQRQELDNLAALYAALGGGLGPEPAVGGSS